MSFRSVVYSQELATDSVFLPLSEKPGKNTGLIGSFSGQGRLTLYNFCREIANIFRPLSCQFSPIPLNCCIEIFSVRGKIG